MRLAGRINILVVTGVVALGLASTVVSIQSLHGTGREQLAGIREHQMGAKQEKLKDLTRVVMRTIEAAHQEALAASRAGADDGSRQAEAQAQAKRLVASFRYGADGDDYFWINDTRPTMVMHPIKPELDGQDLTESKDPNGKKLFVEFVRVAEASGGGFVDYLWPKPGSEVPVAKLSYVALFRPWNWVVGTGVYIDDVEARVAAESARVAAAIQRQAWVHGGIILVATVLVSVLAVILSRRIVRPIRDTAAMLRDIAEGDGDLTGRLPQSRDEFGDLAGAFNAFVAKLQTMIREVAGHAGQVSGSSEELSALSGQMSRGAGDMADRSHTVAAASEEMSANMTNVATAMGQATANLGVISSAVQQMTATIREIAANAERASGVTAQAVATAGSASGRVGELGQAASLIGRVTQTINEISEQTKLLALNATIEAARAGDAGKGFAVVASEIKALARQTAAATEEIRGRVESIQQSTQGTVGEIGQIAGVIEDVNAIVTSIAAAVEEQSLTAREIAGNVSQANRGIHEVNASVAQSSAVAREIAREIADVNQAAREMSDRTGQMSASAQELTRLSARLNGLVARFRA